MGEIFSKILSMLAIVVIGYFIKRIGLVKREDFHVISNILIYVTIPAAVLVNFDGFEMDFSLLILPVIAIVFFFIACFGANLAGRGSSPEDRSFLVLNSSAFNTGAFTLAFIQALLPQASVVTVMLFDLGNCSTTAVFSYIVANTILQGKTRVSLKYVVHQLTHSFVFMLSVTMATMSILHIGIPSFLIAPAKLIAPANVFLAMLSVGIGMEINFKRSELTILLKAVLVRYCVAIPMALMCWFLLPFGLEVRLAMVLVSFSPATLFGAMYTAKLGGNYALANSIISVTIMISTVIMTAMVLILF